MKYKLKSCPFCGDSAEMIERSFMSVCGPVRAYSIRCEGCYISTVKIDESDDTQGELPQNFLIKMWNTRKSNTQ